MRKIFLLPLLLALTACTHQTKNATQPAFVQGKATVVQVDNALGMAILTIDGKKTQAYWDTEVSIPQNGDIANSGPFQTPVGNYREPLTHHIDLPAKSGDTIVFRGMKTGDELFLRIVQVVPN